MRGMKIPAAVSQLRDERAFFSSNELSEPHLKYAGWFDAMGSASIMSRSMAITANFLGKLHTAALKAREAQPARDIQLHPLVDGLYVTSPRQGPFLGQLKAMMRSLALTFVMEEDPLLHFMVRSCVAYGPVWDGQALMTQSHHALRQHESYSRHILLGPPVGQAYREEPRAAPFGVWVHESARTFSPPGSHPLTCTHWNWWRFSPTNVDTELAQTLAQHLEAYLEWCKDNSSTILYPKDRIEAHQELVREYFVFT